MAVRDVFASVSPGRVRLRHPMLRERAVHTALCARLQPLLHESNAAVGSLLLRYDPTDAAMEAYIRAEVAALLPEARSDGDPQDRRDGARIATSPDALDTPASAFRSRTRSRINRIAKIGALTGMAASLAALGVSRGLHARLGVFALSMMLAHVAIHRRRVLR